MANVFLLEDDAPLGSALESVLNHAGLPVYWTRTAAAAREAITAGGFAVAILDVQLPDGSGFDVLRSIRREGSRLPVLMLTVRDAVDDRVRALDDGADDYLIKPCHPAELVSRTRALIRRSAGQSSSTWQIGPLSIEPFRRVASLNGEMLDLSPKEFQLLLELARQPEKVVLRPHLEAAIIGTSDVGNSNLVDVHIFNLRRKMGVSLIRTVRGVGYILELPK